MTGDDWNNLLSYINDGECTPFLGAGACNGYIKKASEIATEWADAHKYPLHDKDDLARVAEYLAITVSDDVRPKKEMAKLCEKKLADSANTHPDRIQIHRALAALNLPIYITTNYDDLMYQALIERGKRGSQQDLCRWNKAVEKSKWEPVLDKSKDYIPSPENPLVYHLHGHKDLPESMVLTEDDYLRFFLWMMQDPQALPSEIRDALTRHSVLFIGYSLRDWNFRVLFRNLLEAFAGNRIASVAVQLPPPKNITITEQKRIKDYLQKYYTKHHGNVIVYWGRADEFASNLQSRWKKYCAKHP